MSSAKYFPPAPPTTEPTAVPNGPPPIIVPAVAPITVPAMGNTNAASSPIRLPNRAVFPLFPTFFISRVLQQEKQSAGQRTEHDFDAQAKQKIRDFISPSNMGRDTCACSSYIHLHASSPAPANITYGPDNIISNTSLLVPLHLPIHIIHISQTPIYPLS